MATPSRALVATTRGQSARQRRALRQCRLSVQFPEGLKGASSARPRPRPARKGGLPFAFQTPGLVRRTPRRETKRSARTHPCGPAEGSVRIYEYVDREVPLFIRIFEKRSVATAPSNTRATTPVSRASMPDGQDTRQVPHEEGAWARPRPPRRESLIVHHHSVVTLQD